MKIHRIFLIGLLLMSQHLFAKVDKIEPLNWWIGFENTNLQLMVYGENISLLTPVINYDGIEIQSITRAQSPNYLFIDLNINESTKAGKFDIQFLNAKSKVSQTIQYELKERAEGSANRKSYDNSDLIYLLFPDRFANGDINNDSIENLTDKIDRNDLHGRRGGDIQGIIDHLDYIKELGVTAIWPTPLLEDNQPHGSYHQYACTDYYNIDARFGNNKLYKTMVEKCHKMDLKVIMDMVPNHCGSEHPWMKDLPFEDWVHGGTKYTQTNYRINTTNDPYGSKIDANLNFNGWFVSEMPDLNQNNPFMLKYLTQNAIWWLEFAGIDGIRVDTYVYNDPIQIAKWTKAILKEYPNLNIVGECWQHSPAEVAYWQSGTKNYNNYDSGLPSVMDFALHDAISKAFTEDEQGWANGVGHLYNTLSQDYLYGNPDNLVILCENHDTQRFGTLVNNVDKFLLGMTFIATTRGIPQIYYGSEILIGGDTNLGHGDIRREMPGGWQDHDRSVFTESGRTSEENRVFEYIKKLMNWRKNNSVVQSGKLLHFVPKDNVYTYFRMNDEKTVMIILNNSPEARTIDAGYFDEVTSPFTQGFDILSDQTIDLTSKFEIKGNSALVLELK